MTKRGKRFLYILLAILAVFICLAIVYIFLVFRPTGYGEIAKRAEESADRVQLALTVRAPAAPLSRTSKHGPAEKDFKIIAQHVNQWHSINREGLERLDYSTQESMGPFEMRLWLWGGCQWVWAVDRTEHGLARDESGKALPIIPTGVDIPENIHQSTYLARWNSLIQEAAFELDFAAIQKADWPALIDKAEDILLRLPESPGVMPRGLAVDLLDDWFQKYAFLAIARAGHRGDGVEAAHMLERFLETVRAARLAGYPESRPFYQVHQMLLALCEMESFPIEGLRRALRIFEDMILSRGQMEDLNNAHLARLKRDIDLAWDWSEYHPGISKFSSSPNFAHYFLEGRVEDAWQKMLRPVAQSHAEPFIKAYA